MLFVNFTSASFCQKVPREHKERNKCLSVFQVAGKITWARQLFRRIHEPMRVFKTYPEILKVSETFKHFV